ncbi:MULTISPECIES: TetR/AcrR family transcriptional regulator [unclassified Streptomyces]|uniref:TetR/AcrR family transcriptional regulator n=1 Tax=unclassified Streptomyces TaxID=2593676 RepID=UPI000DBA9E8F|nr:MULTISPECIES: TetR/AcrR family transcriptional regulator [Streptomyces]MYU06372.1 TetR family transcriptional regulator [Streptomyces sp. SID8366]MYU67780.1 TetR family transcriptional regulator [Streptomyces sp. SID69]RAJ56173.1 TetR family transcriptional regulator [Streptomyces sp. PsTaAH-130]TXJ85958.1 TetR/AcrR family transcriptional regulator [Streptomyces lavendulae]
MAPMTTGNPSRADANRRRILDVALAELLRDPDASMDQIARAAGVVRRTVYGHFPSREALISTLTDEAVQALADADAAGRTGVTDPAEALARSVLALWATADRYRLLIALAQRTVTVQGIRERLAPVRAAKVRVLQQGLEEGVFTSPLPAPALAYVHEQTLFAVMEAVNDGLLAAKEAGRAATVTVLTAAGVPASLATALVTKVSADL